MRGTPEMSVIRMTIRVASEQFDAEGNIEYTFKFPEDVHVPGTPHSMAHELKELGARSFYYDSGAHSLKVVISREAELAFICREVAAHMRWLHDFGGGVQFVHTCSCCGHTETFVQ